MICKSELKSKEVKLEQLQSDCKLATGESTACQKELTACKFDLKSTKLEIEAQLDKQKSAMDRLQSEKQGIESRWKGLVSTEKVNFRVFLVHRSCFRVAWNILR